MSDLFNATMQMIQNNAQNLASNQPATPPDAMVSQTPTINPSLSQEQVAQFIDNVDGASYQAARERGDTSGVSPETLKVAHASRDELIQLLGEQGADAALYKINTGINAYNSASSISRTAPQFVTDNVSRFAGGVAGLGGVVATGAATAVDRTINGFTGSDDYTLTKATANASRALTDFFDKTLTSDSRIAQQFASDARRADRAAANQAKYEYDKTHGKGIEADLAYFGRGATDGIRNAFDTPSDLAEGVADVAGSLIGFSTGIGLAGKAAQVGGKFLPKFLSNMSDDAIRASQALRASGANGKQILEVLGARSGEKLGALDRLGIHMGTPAMLNAAAVGGEGVEQALAELDGVTDTELMESSPVAKLYYDAYIQDGYTPSEAMRMMREKIEANLIIPAFQSGALAGAVSGKLLDKVLRNPLTLNVGRQLQKNQINMLSEAYASGEKDLFNAAIAKTAAKTAKTAKPESFLSRTLAEGGEEIVETAPTPFINAAVQENLDPTRNILDNWGEEVGESGALGALAGSGVVSPATVGRGITKGIKSVLGSKKKSSDTEDTESPSLSSMSEEDRAEGVKEFNAAMETNDTSGLSAKGVSAGLTESGLLKKTSNEEGISEVTPDENLTAEESEYVTNLPLNSSEKSRVTELKNQGLIDKDAVITTKADYYEALLNTAAKASETDENGHHTITLTKDQYRVLEDEIDEMGTQLSWKHSEQPSDARVRNIANWMSNNQNLQNQRNELSSLGYSMFQEEMKDENTVKEINNIQQITSKQDNKSNVELTNSNTFGSVVRHAIASINNISNLITKKESQESDSEVNTQEIDKVIEVLQAVKNGIEHGNIKITSENNRLIAKATMAHEILSQWRNTVQQISKIPNVNANISLVNTQKVGSRTNLNNENASIDSISQEETGYDKPPLITHLNRMLNAYLANDILGYKAARLALDKFIATQNAKLFKLQHALDLYRDTKAGKVSNTKRDVEKGEWTINSNNEESMRNLASAIGLENALMGSLRNLVEVFMFQSSAHSDNYKEHTPFNLRKKNTVFSEIDENKRESSKTAMIKRLKGRGSILNTDAKNALERYLNSAKNARTLMQELERAGATDEQGEFISSPNVENPSTTFNDSQVTKEEEEVEAKSSEPSKEATSGTGSTTSEDTSSTNIPETEIDTEEVSKKVLSAEEEAVKEIFDGIEGTDEETTEPDSETDSKGTWYRELPANDSTKFINKGYRLFTVEAHVYLRQNQLRSFQGGRSKIYSDGAAFFTADEILLLSHNLKAVKTLDNDLSNSTVSLAPTSTSGINGILSSLWKRYTGGKKEKSVTKTVDDLKAQYKKDAYNKLTKGFDSYYQKLNDNFKESTNTFKDSFNNEAKVKNLVEAYNNAKESSEKQKISTEIENLLFTSMNNRFNFPVALFTKSGKSSVISIGSDGVSFELELNKEAVEVAYHAIQQELYNQRNKASSVDLNSPRWENVQFPKGKRRAILDEWEYAVNAHDVISNIIPKVKGYLNIRDTSSFTEAESNLIAHGIAYLMAPLEGEEEGSEFIIKTVTNPSTLNRDTDLAAYAKAVNGNKDTVNVISFKRSNGTVINTLYEPDCAKRASSVMDEIYDYRVDTPINLGSEGKANIDSLNLKDKRKNMPQNRVGKYEQEVIEDRQSEKYTPVTEQFKLYTKFFGSNDRESIDNICKAFTGYTKSEVDEYFKFRALADDDGSFSEEKWENNNQGFTSKEDAQQAFNDYNINKHEFNYMCKLRSSQIPYVQGYETCIELANAMMEALSYTDSLQNFLSEKVPNLTDAEKEQISQHYGYQITVSGRLQDATSSISPVTNKIVRELISNLNPVTITKEDTAPKSIQDKPELATWMLSVNQAFGQKLWSTNLPTAVSNINKYIKELKPELGSTWNKLISIAENQEVNKLTTEEITAIREALDKYGYDVSPLSIHALVDLAQYSSLKAGEQFKSSMYIEVDSRSSGASIMASRYNVDGFTEDEINLMESAGYMVYRVERPSDILTAEPNSHYKRDLYQNSGDKVINQINEDGSKFFAKSNKEVHQIRTATLRLMSVFNPKFFKVDIDKDGIATVKEATRDSGKTTMTPIGYGSQIGGISHQKVSDLLDGIYNTYNQMAEELAEKPDMFNKLSSPKEIQEEILFFIGSHFFKKKSEDISDEAFRKELIETTKEFLADMDTVYGSHLGIQNKPNSSTEFIVTTREKRDAHPIFKWLIGKNPNTLINLQSGSKAYARLQQMVSDASKMDYDGDFLRDNIKICISDPAFRACQDQLGKSVQATMKDIEQLTNLSNLVQHIFKSIASTAFAGTNTDRTLSQDQKKAIDRTKIGKALRKLGIPYGADGSASYPAFKDGIDRSSSNKVAELHINDKTINLFNLSKATPLGEGGKSGLTQGAGDGDVVNILVHLNKAMDRFLAVFDGINIELNNLGKVADKITEAQLESHKQVIYAGMLDAFNAITSILKENPEIFNIENAFSIVGNETAFFMLNLVVPTELHNKIKITDKYTLADLTKLANNSDTYGEAASVFNEITPEVMKKAFNLAGKHYQDKAVSCLAKRTVFHGMPTDESLSKKFTAGSNWEPRKDGLFTVMPLGLFNMDSYGSGTKEVQFTPFVAQDLDGNTINIDTINDWNNLGKDLEPKERANLKNQILNNTYDTNRAYIEGYKDTAFPVTTFDDVDSTPIEKVRTIDDAIKDIFAESTSDKNTRYVKNSEMQFLKRTVKALFNITGINPNNVKYVEISFDSSKDKLIEQIKSLGLTSTEETALINDINSKDNKFNFSSIRGFTQGNLIILNRDKGTSWTSTDSRYLVHELCHIGLSNVLAGKLTSKDTRIANAANELVGSLRSNTKYFFTSLVNSIYKNLNKETRDAIVSYKGSGSVSEKDILKILLSTSENTKDLKKRIIGALNVNNQTSSETVKAFTDMFTQLGLEYGNTSNLFNGSVADSTEAVFDTLLSQPNVLDEAIAWVNSTIEINRYAQTTAANKNEVKKTTGIINSLRRLRRFITYAIKKFFESILNGYVPYKYADSVAGLMSKQIVALRALSPKVTPIAEGNNVTTSQVRHAMSFSNDMNHDELMKLAKDIDKVTNKLLDKRRSYEPEKVQSEYARTMANRDKMLAQINSYGRFSSAQLAVIRSVYTAVAMGIKVNNHIYRQLSATFTKALGAFNQEYLTPENRRNNPNEAQKALAKYRFLMSNYAVDDTNSNEKANRLLPTFMAIAMVDPQLREFFREQRNVPNEPYSSDNNLEQSIVRGTVSLIEKVDSFIDNLKNLENKNLSQLMDGYINNLLSDDKHNSFIGRTIGGWSEAVDDAINKADEKITSKALNVFQPLGKISADIAKKYPRFTPIAAAIKIALMKPFELGGYSRMDIWNATIHEYDELSNSIITGFFKYMSREYMSRSPLTLGVMKAIKVCKDLAEVKSKRYREDMPKEVMKSMPNLKHKDWESLTRSIGKTDITSLTSYRANLSDLVDLLEPVTSQNGIIHRVNLRKTLGSSYQRFSAKYGISLEDLYKYTKPLANYMVTGKFTSKTESKIYDVQRNSDAILHRIGSSIGSSQYDMARQELDEILTLEALDRTDAKDLAKLRNILSNRENHKGFSEVWDILAQTKSVDRAKLIEHNQLLNRWQGYLPEKSRNDKQLAIVEDTPEVTKDLEILGYKKVGTYQKSTADKDKKNFAYYACDYNPEAAFMSGGLQLMNYTAGGINLESGRSIKSVRPAIYEPDNALATDLDIREHGNGSQPLIPIYGYNNKIIGFERTADPKFTEDFIDADMHLPTLIGEWVGRQHGESDLRNARKEVIRQLKKMYDDRVGATYKFIDLLDPKTYKRYPHIKEVYDRISRGSLYDDIYSVWRPSNPLEKPKFMVRIDLLEQIAGQRRASISEIFLDPKSDFAKGMSKVLDTLFGSARLIRWEHNIQRGMVTLKNNIVVKGVQVPIQNITANMIELNMLGVPARSIFRGIIDKTRECESYLRMQQELLRLDYQLAQQSANGPEYEKLIKRKNEINEDARQLSIYPLIEMGEFNTITDVATIREDLAIVQGKYGDLLDQKIEELPDDVQKGLKQLIVSKDTGLYKLLSKAVQYGDLVAKSILYDDVLKRQKKGRKQAEYMATTFFVDYDLMPGRTRDYLESIGLMWFYNYKLRMSKVLVHMFTNNPLRLLLWGLTPQGLGFSALDTPLKDSALGRLLGFGPALSSTAFFGAPGMVVSALTSNPWLILAGLIF